MMDVDTRSGVALRRQPLAVRIAIPALLIGGIAAAWAGLAILIRNDQQTQGVPVAAGVGLLILGTGFWIRGSQWFGHSELRRWRLRLTQALGIEAWMRECGLGIDHRLPTLRDLPSLNLRRSGIRTSE